MSSPYCNMLAGVKLVPEERKVQPDVLLLAFMVVFFTYVTWLMVRNLDDKP